LARIAKAAVPRAAAGAYRQVSTLYTEAMQREAAMRVMLEQQGKTPPS